MSGVSTRREGSLVFIDFTSFQSPGIMYQCNLKTKIPDMKVFREIVVHGYQNFKSIR